MTIHDNEYKGYVELIMDLDWEGYDLWLVGGILSHDTKDIDVVINGPYDPPKIIALMEECKKMGPWDITYSTVRPLEDPYEPRVIQIAINRPGNRCRNAFGMGAYQHGMCWLPLKIPSQKMLQRKNVTYQSPVLLIQNGQQIYL